MGKKNILKTQILCIYLWCENLFTIIGKFHNFDMK